MRLALGLVASLAVLATGCSSDRRPVMSYEDNTTTDMRGGKGTDERLPVLPISTPPHLPAKPGFPDGPVTERAMAMTPVNPGVTPIAASRLAALLPAPPKDWTAEEASGHELATPQGLLTQATRSYWAGPVMRAGATPDGREGHRSIDLTVVDRGQTGPAVVALASVAADERRGVTASAVQVEGFSGQEFVAGPGLRQLDLDVGDRFLVHVRGGNVSAEDLRAWAARLPLKDLAAMR